MNKELSKLNQEIENNNFNTTILLVEKNKLEKALKKRDMTEIINLNNFYKDKSCELRESFDDSFKILNRILYNLRESFKSEPINTSHEDTYNLIKDSREKFIKEVKNRFQKDIDSKERIIDSYKLLESVSYNLLKTLY